MSRRFLYPMVCLFGLVSLIVFSGCGSVGKLGGVTVSVLSIRPSPSASSADSKAMMTLQFTNENVVPIGISRVRHKLYLNGTLVSDIRNEQAVGIPPLKTITQEIALPFEKPEVLSSLRALAQQPHASYRIESVLYVEAGEDTMEIKTQHQGSVDLSAFRGP
ncbi:MAG: hypothetical protein K1X42_16290 [Opitutaceae bacterium]|nr:hypothetical protein [Opitutaceae bacterium]